MRFFIATFILAAMAVLIAAEMSAEAKQKIAGWRKECLDELPTFDDDLLTRAQNDARWPDDQRLKDFFFCYGKKSGSFNEDGSFNVPNIKAKLTKGLGTNMDSVVDECTATDRGNGPQNAFELARCFQDKLPPREEFI